MTRTARLKAAYVAVLGIVSVAAAMIIRMSAQELLTILAVTAFLLAPGRIQGILYRDLFRGRRLFDGGHAREAIPHFERFLALLHASPWKNFALWLSWSVYTTSAEAMTLNNLGAAHLAIGDDLSAHKVLSDALALDSQYPIPHFNLAVLYAMRGDSLATERAASEALRLGYKASTADAAIHRAQSVLAAIEGR